MSVRLSLCGGSRTGAEGCRMHQNMCVPAALMACRGSEKAIPSSVPAASSFLKDLPPNFPFLTSGPCTSWLCRCLSLCPWENHCSLGIDSTICAMSGQCPRPFQF